MRELISDIHRWRQAGVGPWAVATIVETRGSSLRPAGSRMLLSASGEVAGSVSSGCVDGEVIAELEAVLSGQAAPHLLSYGISDAEAWEVQLACGGAIEVLVERWGELHDALLEEVEAERPVGFASRLDGSSHLLYRADGTTLGSLGDPALDARVCGDLRAAWPGPYASRTRYPQGEVFVEVIAPPPVLLIFGATDIGAALAELAHVVGFRVIVSDARRTFLRAERFPHAELRLGWPQKVFKSEELGTGWAVVVLFHDSKFDVPALTLALNSPAFYIGLLGSPRTQADRRQALREAGLDERALARIFGPTGLDIGGKEPAYIALSILAEVVAVRHRRSGEMMSQRVSQRPRGKTRGRGGGL